MLYTCALCGDVFQGARSDEEALKEYEQTFGKEVVENEPSSVICDTCYKKVDPARFEEIVENVKAKYKTMSNKEDFTIVIKNMPGDLQKTFTELQQGNKVLAGGAITKLENPLVIDCDDIGAVPGASFLMANICGSATGLASLIQIKKQRKDN